tara:strand:+ start:3908 stop:4201 length:294 start_codon:yes stop_codon:yes gene_type:complete
MSVNINISSENNNCSFYANFLSRNKIKSKIYPSIFIQNERIYDGCTISLENKFNNQKILNSIIKNISKEISISYLQIDGLIDGDLYYPYHSFIKLTK